MNIFLYKNKKHKNTTILLLSMLMVFCFHVGYVDASIDAGIKTAKIKNIYLCEDVSDNEKICDLGGGSYQARVIRSMSEAVRLPEYFGVKNSNKQLVKAAGVKLQIESDDKNNNNVWFITGILKPEDVKDAEYIVHFDDANESSGYIPVLRLSTYSFSPEIVENKNLTLTNISSKEIKNIEITKQGKYVSASIEPSNLPLSISGGGSFSLVLHPETCFDTDVKTDSIVIKYEMEESIIESKIIIESPCDEQGNLVTHEQSFKEFANQHTKAIAFTLLGGGLFAEEAIRRVINLRPNIEDERARDQNERHELELEGAQGITPQVLDVAFYVDKVNRLAIKARSAAFRAKAESDRAERICPPPKAILAKTQSNQADRSATDAESAARIAQRGLDQFRNKQITYSLALNLAKVIQFNKAKQAVKNAEAAANQAKAIADSCVGSHDDSSGGCMTLPADSDGAGNTGLAERGASIPLTGTEFSVSSAGSAPPFGAGLGGHTESGANTEKQPVIIESDHGTQQSLPTVDDYAEKNDGSKNSQSSPSPSKNNDRYGLEKLQRELTYFGAWPQANNIFIPTSPLFDKGDFFPSTFEILGNQLPSFSGLPSKGTSTEPITHLKYTTPTYIEYQKYQAPPQHMEHTKYQTQTYIEYPNYPIPPPYRIPSTPPKIFGYQR